MVTVVANGRQHILAVRIDPALLRDRDAEMLQDLVRAATNDALRRAADMAQEEMAKVTGRLGLKIPGLVT
jgi:DNA-binding YbaB/EbfC family protein